MALVITKGWKITSGITISGLYIPDATGGTITTSGNYKIHTFTSTGSITFTTGGLINYVIVAGGGGGWIGGGGAGGLITGSVRVSNGDIYTITVGGPGEIGVNGSDSSIVGGTAGIFLSPGIVSTGGGYGGLGGLNRPKGGNGGSGGGGTSTDTPFGSFPKGIGIQGQGNDGGKGQFFNIAPESGAYGYGAGGGGGAGGPGGDPNNNSGGNGGIGLVNPIVGSTSGQNVNGVYYLAGGGGGESNTDKNDIAGLGGYGGGGNGKHTNKAATAGMTNTGGGGGGGAVYGGGSTDKDGNAIGTGAQKGGSGIVIISYQYQ
jgi:hypothetical protein